MIAVHEHHWNSGPKSNRGRDSIFEHAHELPSKFHRHPCSGPGHSYTWKEAKKTRGEQLRFIPPEPGEDTFAVVVSDRYTSEHERNGMSREDFAGSIAIARAVVAGQIAPYTGRGAIEMTAHRLEGGFGLRAIWRMDDGGAWCCGKPREAHADWNPVGNSWHCPEADERDRQYRARLAEQIAAEMAEMGWAA